MSTINVEVYFKAKPGRKADGTLGIQLLPRLKDWSAIKPKLASVPTVALERFGRNGVTKLGEFKSHDNRAPVFSTMDGATSYMERITKEVAAGINANLKVTTTQEAYTAFRTVSTRPTATAAIG